MPPFSIVQPAEPSMETLTAELLEKVASLGFTKENLVNVMRKEFGKYIVTDLTRAEIAALHQRLDAAAQRRQSGQPAQSQPRRRPPADVAAKTVPFQERCTRRRCFHEPTAYRPGRPLWRDRSTRSWAVQTLPSAQRGRGASARRPYRSAVRSSPYSSGATSGSSSSGSGTRFDPGHGRLMKEWLVVEPTSDHDWLPLAREALAFVAARR